MLEVTAIVERIVLSFLMLTGKPSVSTTLKTGVGKRRDFTDTSLYQEVSHEQEVYRPTFG